MLPPRIWRPLVLFLVLPFTGPSLSALVVEGRWYRGQHVQCVHGGDWLNELNLGVYSRARLYEKVFTGTVQSVVEVSFTDRRLRIISDEVFLGYVAGEVTATVNQACLPEEFPEIKAGDKWVFCLKTKKYLRPEANPPYITTDGLMVVFDSPGKPVSQAGYDLCLLRLHSDVNESCAEAMTTPPPEPDLFCGWNGTASPLANPFIHADQQPVHATFQPYVLNIANVAVPKEFRARPSSAGNDGGLILQPRTWPQECSPHVSY